MLLMDGEGMSGGGFNPFENIFGDLARLLGKNAGPLNWDVARQVTVLIAGEGESEGNVDPVDRIRVEEVTRVAQLHVERHTGTNVVIRSVETSNHQAWALKTLDDYRVMLESLATSISSGGEPASTDIETSTDPMRNMEQFMAPVLLGMQVGGMVGHLARRSFAQFDLPVPRPSFDTPLFVPANINAFADDWSITRDELTLYVALEEVTRLSVLQRPHVRQRFNELITQYVSGFRPDFSGLQDSLTGLDMSDPSQLPAALTDPNAILGAIQTPEQQHVLAQLHALTAAFVGYVDHVVESIAPSLSGMAPAIAEATRRRRVEESEGSRLVERLFGLELGQQQFDRGHAFIAGVLERVEDASELEKLWLSARELPTPNEIDAPGLWLARIELPAE
jgi:putative hydrolase